MTSTPVYAQLAARVYAAERANRTEIPTGWNEVEWIPDRWNGFSAGVYQNGNDIVIAYTGTNGGKAADLGWANVLAATGLPTPQVTEAMLLYFQVRQANPSANITFTGHSLGNGIAAMEYYYFKDAASATALFGTEGNGLHFKYSDIGASQYKSLPLLAQAVQPFLGSGEDKLADAAQLMAQDAWHIQSGTSGMIWSGDSAIVRDVAIGGAQTDVLDGGGGADILIGGAGIDFLTGGEGDDALYGGLGDDQLNGGAGHDRYVIEDGDGIGNIRAYGGNDFIEAWCGDADDDKIYAGSEVTLEAAQDANASGDDIFGDMGTNELQKGMSDGVSSSKWRWPDAWSLVRLHSIPNRATKMRKLQGCLAEHVCCQFKSRIRGQRSCRTRKATARGRVPGHGSPFPGASRNEALQ